MTTTVPRHHVPTVEPEEYVEMLAEDAAEAIEYLDLAEAFDTALAAAQGRSIVDPSAADEETWRSYVTAAEVGAALFAAAAADAGAVISRVIAGTEREITTTGPQSHADAATWRTAFWLAVVCRDRDKATLLADIPIALLRKSEAICDAYIYDWADTLRTYWHGDPDRTLGDKLVAAVEGCAPSAVQIIDAEQALKLVHPPMNLFYHLIRQDQDGFNAALAEALESHRSFYSGERAIQIQGLVPIELLAIACLGHEAGLSVEVESDYLPAHLVRGKPFG
ncbi:immunity 49 family protein [Nonomuraea sp. NPDC046802]|uniref:immunity 49 family protein n=1 Tax=Nonomuraea sp. NPDC046802 TaxID=3154919 RepID=UPI0033D57BB7